MADLQKIKDEMAQLIAEARRQLEAKKANNGDFNVEEFQKRLEKALADARAASPAADSPKNGVNANDLLFSKSDSSDVKEFREFNDNCVLLASMTGKSVERLDYFHKGIGRFKNSGAISKAMDTSEGGKGQDWIPTGFSTDLYDRVRLEAVTAAQFPEIQMATNPYKVPTSLTDPATFLTPENTADPTPTQYTTSQPTTGNIVLTASKLTTNILFSDELVEDSIIPFLDFLKRKLAYSMAYALEDALLNGDTTSPHMDADVTASGDPRKAWKGIRRLALVSADTSLSTWAPATSATGIGLLRSMRGKMGRYGTAPSKLRFFVGPKGLIQLLSMPEVMTLEKFGPFATIITGELARVDGISVIVSEKMREDVNASGFNDSTTNSKGVLLLAYVPGFVRGIRRDLQVRPWYDPRSGTQNLVQDWRGDFEPVYSTSDPIAVKGINWAV